VILPMAEVQLIGPRDLLAAALAFLQDEGALELRTPEAAARPDGTPFVRPCTVRPDAAEHEARLVETIQRAGALAARLPPARAAEHPAVLPSAGTAELLARLGGLEEEVSALEARRTALLEEREATSRFERLVVALAPLRQRLDPSLLPETHGLVLKNDPEALVLLQAEVRRMTDGRCDIQSRQMDPEHVGVLVTVPRSSSQELTSLLFERGVEEVKLPSTYAGKTFLETLLLLVARERAIPQDIAAVDAALEALSASHAGPLADVARGARAALERLRATGQCGSTRFAFVVSGYMPVERLERFRAAAASAFGGRVEVIAREPPPTRWGEVPVVLRNRRWMRPFQLLLALVPLPRYGSIDPTPWLSVFFPLFFGLVLGDVAFGVVGIALALVARSRRWGGDTGRNLAWIALCCSASALLFGILYGEALGELGEHLGLHPLFDRRNGIMAFLGGVLAVGFAHVVIGMVLGIASSLRGGHRRHAIGRAGKLGLLLSGAICIGGLAGGLPRAVLLPAAGVLCVSLVAAVVAEGFLAALDLVLALGNVLSYARLMALGLASVMLAEVANMVAVTLRPLAAGIAIAVLLHLVNFTLCLVSPIVAALRLHYVEFFEKFYDEGGEPFRPFALA
jgi:V/A-type H+-transporting ATPase subunit I